jgi:sterol desaturase/sphingolipid hydroxylase (fatty acid hydroxylase superfamily)
MAEAISPLFKFDYQKIRHIGVNTVFLFSSAIVSAPLIALHVATCEWVETEQFGLLNLIELPMWLELLIALAMFDFVAQYGTHYLLHHVRWMWRLHLVHHADTHVDATSGFRHHPGDAITRSMGTLVAVIIFGIPFSYFFLYRLITIFFGYVTHANFHLPDSLDRIIGCVFVTPNMHKFHHHHEAPWTDSNFGNVFSIWDRMLGTLVYENPKDIKYGLDILDSARDEDIGYQFMLPFDSSVKTNDRPGLFQ